MQLEKVYEPQRFEPHWAQWWIDSGLYHVPAIEPVDGASHQPATNKSQAIFSLVIPPPNVTGSLHIGHMLEHTVMDVAVRWHRMKGERTLWVPGTDHAGIATQMVVEKQLAKEGVTRRQLGREDFERRVWQWKEQYGGRISLQMRREGASVDWSRERFTMDARLSRAVRETFVRLWEKGLIYRGEYMVNWCPRCATAISDIETIHESVEGSLWYIRYSVIDSDQSLVVATTRPETMLGDTAVAVHPDDERYRALIGKMARLPLVGREIPIVADTMVDPKFGTGAVKITPAHDPNDFEAGKRHGLPIIKVIGEDARMTGEAGAAYAELDRFEARKRIVAALEASGELVKTEPYTLSVSKCDRCKTIIEPLVSKQWFMRMRGLADRAVEAVNSGQIQFVPDDREAVFFQWMANIRDWCISRQLWWGHRIPAWHCRNCEQITVARETPAVCPHCHSTELVQDTDVLDTWFSSGLWPFSTLGWPDETDDLKTFYPTTLLITGFDILYLWVSRMMMLGLELTGQVPFRQVHMHGLVRDAEGQKMSKTKGNVVDPLDIMERYGTDACRIALLISVAPGADIALQEDRLDSGRGFANKLWNASRWLFLNMERSGVEWAQVKHSTLPVTLQIEDEWILERLRRTMGITNAALGQHRYHEATQASWDFVWHDFCDWYLEVKKQRFTEQSGVTADWVVVLRVYEAMLRLLHPLMPFITEELWHRLKGESGDATNPKSISLAQYPETLDLPAPDDAGRSFEFLTEVVTAVRELRADYKLDTKSVFPARLHIREFNAATMFSEDTLGVIGTMTRVQLTRSSEALPDSGIMRSAKNFDVLIEAATQNKNGAISPENRIRIGKEITTFEGLVARLDQQLGNEAFLAKAPEKIVAGMREKRAEYEAQIAKLRKQIEGLGA